MARCVTLCVRACVCVCVHVCVCVCVCVFVVWEGEKENRDIDREGECRVWEGFGQPRLKVATACL